MPINKPWEAFEPPQAKAIPATVGVYELADGHGNVIYIGRAGAQEPFGLRSRLQRHFSFEEPNAGLRDRARLYRYEVTMQYMTRHVELLTLHREEFGQLPEANLAAAEPTPRLGRFHWKPSTGRWQP